MLPRILSRGTQEAGANLVPPAQANEEPPADVFHGPKVKGHEQHDDDKVEHKVGAEPGAEKVRGQRRRAEKEVEKHRRWVPVGPVSVIRRSTSLARLNNRRIHAWEGNGGRKSVDRADARKLTPVVLGLLPLVVVGLCQNEFYLSHKAPKMAAAVSSTPGGIPMAKFVDDVDKFMATGEWGTTAEAALKRCDELYSKYKFMESQLLQKASRCASVYMPRFLLETKEGGGRRGMWGENFALVAFRYLTWG
jgi:hypothetical protein